MLLHDSEHVTVAQSLISRNIPKDSAIRLRNIQSAYVILGVLGPNSRPLLQALTQASLDKTAFPAHYMKVDICRTKTKSFFIAQLPCDSGAPWISKSTNRRKFGNPVTVHRTSDRPSAPQAYQ